MEIQNIRFSKGVEFDMYKDYDFVVRGFSTGWERITLTSWLGQFAMEPIAMANTTVLDIGAYSGIYTLLSAKIGINVDVHAFEPVPQVYQRLTENIELNRPWFKGNDTEVSVFAHNIGLSKYDGNHIINITGDNPLPSGSSIDPHPNKATIRAVDIVTRTGDSFFKENPLRKPLSIVKIDVERHELNVIEGLAETLERYMPVCFVELLSHEEFMGVYSFMKALGYTKVLQIDDAPINPAQPYSILVDESVVITSNKTNFIFRK